MRSDQFIIKKLQESPKQFYELLNDFENNNKSKNKERRLYKALNRLESKGIIVCRKIIFPKLNFYSVKYYRLLYNIPVKETVVECYLGNVSHECNPNDGLVNFMPEHGSFNEKLLNARTHSHTRM